MVSGIYSALSGLLGFSRKIESTANNVANVDTPGFKASRVSLLGNAPETVSTASGASQVGRGVSVGSIDKMEGQGGFESTSSPTDLAIGGQGFFLLRNPESAEADKFSRAGGFKFDQEGFLVSPNGYRVQGWAIDPATGENIGSVNDINIGTNTPPTATQKIDLMVNVDAKIANESTDVRLFDAWDGRKSATADPSAPIDSTNFDFSTSIKIVDSQGSPHDITVYFDKTTIDNEWEYLVTTNPLEDRRNIDPALLAASAPHDRYDPAVHKGAGALLYGTMTFSESGKITAISAYTVPPDGVVNPALNDNKIELDGSEPYFSFPTNFTGDAVNQGIQLNLGARHDGSGGGFRPEALSSTRYANTSSTVFQNQDGSAAGFLQSVSVTPDGIISGRYSNGQVLKRARVALATFNNTAGLSAEGGNLFSATNESGAPITRAPSAGGLGSVAPHALEMSNVELAEEFTSLMISKRYFQANLKIIKAEDERLGSILDIKG